MAQPPRRRRVPDNSKSDSTSGLLSNVFSFVSREFESFIHNATAGKVNQPTSSARVRSSGRRRNDADLERNTSDDEARRRSRVHQHRQARGRPKPRSKSTDPTKKHQHRHVQPTYIDVDEVLSASDRERSKSPTPRPQSASQPAPIRTLKKQPSITMPGSLFPRSSSLGPDTSDREHSTQLVSHVPPPADNTDASEGEPGPSRTSAPTNPTMESIGPTQSPLDQFVSPWRTRSVASVQAAVQRFNATDGVEADFSLMLPSPQTSPVKPASKARSEESRSPQSTRPNPPAPAPTSRKGKERAREDMIDEDLDFIVGPSTGHAGVFAKERELEDAREEQRKHERHSGGDQSRRASDERERDKQRIKALEEEVKWLKEELSRSQHRSSPPLSSGPPPPPPPPPPPSRPLRIDMAPGTPTNLFAGARASLRHAMTPVEAPINAPGLSRTKRQGKPTVNVPSEKMAAFLNEIKTARLRKVGGEAGGESIAGPSGFSRSVAGTSSTAAARPGKLSAKELLRRRSLANLRVPIGSALAAPVPPFMLAASLPASAFKEPEARVGQKRKADATETEETTGRMPKRRMTQSSQSSSGASQNSATSTSILHLSDLAPPSHTLASNETDITTPSLCSDNEREAENSIEDRVPSTPPGPRPSSSNPNDARRDTHEAHIEVIDVDMEEPSHPEPRTITPSSVPRRTSDLFKKRPPTSPVPNPTPRRPSAPARTKRGATPKPKAGPPPESEDEDGTQASTAPVPFISLIPAPKSKPKTKPSLAGKGLPRAKQQTVNQSTTLLSSASGSQAKRKKTHKRRLTLDEELRTAEARSSDIDQGNDELGSDVEDDVFVGKGTKSSRKGFLAHGGGGGMPIFMGVGYVQGAEAGSGDEDRAMETQPRRIHKSSSQVSLIPRPKVRT